MKNQLDLTEKQARVFEDLHNQLEKHQKAHRELGRLKSSYEDICKNTIIMDDEDAATVCTYKRVANDLEAILVQKK